MKPDQNIKDYLNFDNDHFSSKKLAKTHKPRLYNYRNHKAVRIQQDNSFLLIYI